MKKRRREFLKVTGITCLGMASGAGGFPSALTVESATDLMSTTTQNPEESLSIIGDYGQWAASLAGDQIPALSFRKKGFTDAAAWRAVAGARAEERLAIPNIGKAPVPQVHRSYTYDGLHIEELSWQLPYGEATHAVVLKPQHARGFLPGILAFHDHGGNKYFGTRKIIRTPDTPHPLIVAHQEQYYESLAWANAAAKKGYVVLASDAFTFGSRRVLMKDVPPHLRQGLDDSDPENTDHIHRYNAWAGDHEHIMAKSLFCAGTTWPGVFFAEDRIALDILCARSDVDPARIGCAGLSGGGLRTVMMGGLDPRIKCAVTAGFMSTWKDFLLSKSFTHTWMLYVPLLPNELDFPEILGLRVPLPTLVLNNTDDQLYTLPEMKRADEMLREIYVKAKADDRYHCSFYPGAHKFDARMQEEAFAWLDRWLK